MKLSSRRLWIGAWLGLLAASSTRPCAVLAQEPPSATPTASPIAPNATAPSEAEALFVRGRELLNGGHYVEACPLLARSQEAEAATGTLLALAICYERSERLASALAAYREVERRANEEGRADRAQAARDKVAELGDRVSTVTLYYAANDKNGPRPTVSLNGVEVPSEALEKPLPVDGGTLYVEACWPDHEPWRWSVRLGRERDSQNLTIPSPSAGPARAPAMVLAPARWSAPSHRERGARWLRPLGIASVAVGGAGLLAAGALTLRAIDRNHASEEHCNGNVCELQGRDARDEARSAGNTATVAVSVGGAVSAAGLLLLLWPKLAPRGERERALSAAPWATGHAAGATIRGEL